MRNRKNVLLTLLGLLMVLTLAVTGCGEKTTTGANEPAQKTTETKTEPIKLTLSIDAPETHVFSAAAKAYIDKIKNDTKGQVQITPYFSGSLITGKEAFAQLAQGVADISDYSGAYMPTGFEIEKAMRGMFWGLPEGKKGFDVGTKAYDELRQKYSAIDAEHKDVKVLTRFAITPYQLFTTKKPVRSAEDLKGMKIKFSGIYGDILKDLGAAPISLPMSEAYIALQKGIIDGILAPYSTLTAFKFGEVVKYVTPLGLTVGPTPHWGMNWNSYNALPKDIQKVFDDNQVWWAEKLGELQLVDDQAGIDFAKKQGVQFVEMDKSGLDKFNSVMDKVVIESMKPVDAAGKQGTQMYEDARSLIEKHSK